MVGHKGWHCSITQQIGRYLALRVSTSLGFSSSVLLAVGYRQGVRATNVR